MRKILTVFLILCLLSCTVLAADHEAPKVVDQASLLTAEQADRLSQVAEQISDTYHADVVIVTVDSLDGKRVEAYADDYFDYNGYGRGSDYSGILFLLSMEYRNWAISTSGSCIRIFEDRQIDGIFDRIQPDLSSGRYYSAFSLYLDLIEDRFEAYAEGDRVSFGDIAFRLFIALAIGAIAGGATLAAMRSSMNTAKRQTGAAGYVVDGSFRLYRQQDLYLYSRTARTRKQQNNGGSSTHRSSSGRSHGGWSGRF